MESFSRLRGILVRVLENGLVHYDEQDLFDELMVQKSRLLLFFNVGGRNPEEQREIESGRMIINDKQVAMNSDFARHSIFLSQQLDCSERYAAKLLNDVMLNNPNSNPVQSLELTVAEYHKRRRDLADCIDLLIQTIHAANESKESVLSHLSEFVVNQLVYGIKQGDDLFGIRLFRAIDGLDSVLSKAEIATKNAGSSTVVSSGQSCNTTALGYDALNSRYESLKYERRQLANAYASMSRLGLLSPNDIKLTVDWLARNPNHPMTFYLLTTAFNALDPARPGSAEYRRRMGTVTDKALTDYMKNAMSASPTQAWKDPSLKAAVLLKWTLCQADAKIRDSALENREGFQLEDLETQVWNAIQGDALLYMSLAVQQLQRKRVRAPSASITNTFSLSAEQLDHRTVPPEDFKLFVLSAFDALVRLLIAYASAELRKIKLRQEDLASARTDRVRSTRFATSVGVGESEELTRPRNDIAMLYSFIGLLYASLPHDWSIQFWNATSSRTIQPSYLEYICEIARETLPKFLQWAVWSTMPTDIMLSTALYDMLGGLAQGELCSELASNFMAKGLGEIIEGGTFPSSSTGPSISWNVIFGTLESWAASSVNIHSQQQQQQQHMGVGGPLGSTFSRSAMLYTPPAQQMVIGPKQVLLAQSFLYLLSTVVAYSASVRTAIVSQAKYRAIPTLVSLIPLGIPLELKGSLFETLSAFCEPGAGVPGIEICKAVWTLMEKFEVINVKVTATGPFGSGIPAKGVEAELEEVEAAHRLYPSTIPFLKLLSTLMHTRKRIPLKERLTNTHTLYTIPETLGQPYRLPGVGPFTSFVIDNVFTNIPNREYSRPSDRWQMNDLCLSFMERALASFELESLIANQEVAPFKEEHLIPLLIHPGFDIMKRMLTRSSLQVCILSYIVDGVKGFEKDFAEDEPFFGTTIVRVLRIVHRVLEIQDIFLDILIPLLLESDSSPIVGPVHSRSFYTKFDQELLFGTEYVPSIAAYITYQNYPELVFLSIKILSVLSSGSSSSTLATLMDKSADSERILAGFMDLINIECFDDIADAETSTGEVAGAGAPDLDETPQIAQAIRLAALDLVVQETAPSRPYPSVAHFLLFGANDSGQQIQDPHALGSRRTSIHVIIDLINAGVPRLKGKEQDRDNSTPLFISLPGLAERCYRVIYQLCMHPKTYDFTTRYLRTREDFFARQLASMPSKAPQAPQEHYVQVQYNDGSRVLIAAPSLASFLRLRSCILELAALDLHILTNKGHTKGVSDLLEILFGNVSDYDVENAAFQDIGQSHIRIVEFLQSLLFEWSDSMAVAPMDLQFFGQLNLMSCVRTNSTGCDIIDRTALLSLLTTARHILHGQGSIVTATHADQLQREAVYILESCVIENHRREIAHAVATGFESWRRLLDLSLTKCFDRLPHDRREDMLFDLLHVLPVAIRSPETGESTAILLSEAVLSSITRLREDRRQQLIAQSAGGNAKSGFLPAERLYAMLRNILEAIIENNRAELVRGNLYATLINTIHLLSSAPETDVSATRGIDNLKISVTASASRDGFDVTGPITSRDGVSTLRSSDRPLQAGSLLIMKDVMERLIVTVSRDAIDGTEIWKSVAFMLLDALVQLSGVEKNHIVLAILTRQGILSNFVRGLKDSDLNLLSVLKPDPDDLNSLYVYEAKMSFFIRMTQTRAGAERLLEAQLLPVLARCDFLDAWPETDQSFLDRDSFLPSAVHRYHQLFMPALQVVDGMLATLSSKHGTVVNQALNFLTSHSATISILLKNDTDYVPLALLDEIHLITTLCANVLPSVPKNEVLSSNSGFGAIHAAVLNLASRCLGHKRCFANIYPQTTVEVQWSNEKAFGYGSQTRFDMKVQQREHLLIRSIIAYIGTASDLTEPEVTLVLSPVTLQLKHDEQPTLATVPTMGGAIDALNSICSDLTEILKQIAELGAELAVATGNDVNEITRDIQPSLIQNLNVRQKQQLVSQELEKVKKVSTREVWLLLECIEMLLLLVWRHVQYYASAPVTMPASSTPLSLSALYNKTSKNQGPMGMSTAMRFLTAPDPETFKTEVGRRLGPTLDKLERLDLTSDTEIYSSSRGYIEIMARRLRDSAGLLVPSQDSKASPN